MDIVSTKRKEFIVGHKVSLVDLTSYAIPGTKALCLEDQKAYVYMGQRTWESLNVSGGNSGGNSGGSGGDNTMHTKLVNDLPSVGEEGFIYLVPSTNSAENNAYDEYIYVNGWEKIGAVDSEFVPIDLDIIDDYFNEP